MNHYPEDIYQATLSKDDIWMSPLKMDLCKPNFNEASVSVSIDERRVYTYNDKKGNGDIYFSDLKNGTFTPIAPILVKQGKYRNEMGNTLYRFTRW